MTQPVALVTGGASGIGLATARRLRERGLIVVTLDLADPPDDSCDLFVRCDVSDSRQVQETVGQAARKGGPIRTLVNCAGAIERGGTLEDIDPTDFDRVAGVNLKGVLLTVQHTCPFMKQAGGGAIVNIGSISGICGAPAYPIYAATKGGLISLGLSLAKALARHNIRVNTICPGSVPDTGFARRQLGRDLERSERLSLIKKVPLRQVVRPEEIARWADFLCSPDSGPVTGAVFTVDGGEHWGERQ